VKSCDDGLQIFSVASRRPEIFSGAQIGVKVLGRGPQLITSWLVGYAASKVCSANVIIGAWRRLLGSSQLRLGQQWVTCGIYVHVFSPTWSPLNRVCLCCLRVCLYVCLLAYNSGSGGEIVSKFSGCPRDGFMCQKFGEGVMGRGQNIDIFRFLWDRPAMRHGRQIGHCDRHWTGYRRAHRCRRAVRSFVFIFCLSVCSSVYFVTSVRLI